jgi:Flp pilus assembly CpaE family ATPase
MRNFKPCAAANAGTPIHEDHFEASVKKAIEQFSKELLDGC